jgi:chitinase
MDVPVEKITHINYAFVDLTSSCTIQLYDPWSDVQSNFNGGCVESAAGNFNALKQLRNKYPHLKILLSYGGWTLSKYFSQCSLDTTTRNSVAKQMANLVDEHDFDGVDIDWEYPGWPGAEGNTIDDRDPENYILLIDEVRKHLSAGKDITIASGMSAKYIDMMSKNNVLQRLCAALDWVNLMTYDYHGAWSDLTGHLAPLYHSGNPQHEQGNDIASGVEAMIAAGCPAEKLVLGLPFYGRTWKGARPGDSNGLWVTGAEPGCGSFEPANRDFTDIDKNMVNQNGYQEHWDDVCKVPYLYKESTGEFVSYDNEQSIGIKVDYVNTHNLGGVMFWELSNDREEKLLDVIVDRLDGCARRVQDIIV